MKSITVYSLTLQFDGNSNESDVVQARKAVDLINLTLQREPYGLGAQILTVGNEIKEVQSEETDRDLGL